MFLRSLLPRFSIRQLLIWTAFIGFACVSLRNASETWVAITFAVVLVILGATPMLVILRQRPERAYWMGFAMIGGLYLGLLMYSFAVEPNVEVSNPFSAGNLATARLARYCHGTIYGQGAKPNQLVLKMGTPPTQQIVQIDGQMLISLDQTTKSVNIQSANGSPLRAASLRLLTRLPIAPAGPAQDDFVNVAHALWTLLLAACGGWFGRWLYHSRPKDGP